jgi:ABC-type uncharacterized transport system ATPase subunit
MNKLGAKLPAEMSVPTLIPIAQGVSSSDVIDAFIPNEDKSAVMHVEDSHKRPRNLAIRRGITVEIKPGDVSDLPGPNGASKTTAIEIPEGLRQPDSGTVTACGMAPTRHRRSSLTPGPSTSRTGGRWSPLPSPLLRHASIPQ